MTDSSPDQPTNPSPEKRQSFFRDLIDTLALTGLALTRKKQEFQETELKERFDVVQRQAEGMNMTVMTILSQADGLPRRNTERSIFKGVFGSEYNHDYDRNEVVYKWISSLAFGGAPDGRISDFHKPILASRKPRFVLGGITTDVDEVTIVVVAPKTKKGYGAPRTEIYINEKTRGSTGRELLDGTSKPTGAARVELDDEGQVCTLMLARNNATGMLYEEISPNIVDGLPSMLQEILLRVKDTTDTFKMPGSDFSPEDIIQG